MNERHRGGNEMETEISTRKLQEFIENESTTQESPLDIARRIEIRKLEILELVQQEVKVALKEKNSAMVAAIAEILKTI